MSVEPKFIYDTETNLEGVHYSRLLESLMLQATYVEGADFPQQNDLIEVRFMDTVHLAMVQYSQIMQMKDTSKYIHIQAQRVK